MKKGLLIGGIFVVLAGIAIFFSFFNARTDKEVNETWTLEQSTKIEKIELYGSEQPLFVEVVKTDHKETKISLTGKVSQSSLDLIKTTKVNANEVYIPLTKKGFKLSTYALGKDNLTLKIELAKDATMEHLLINTWVGEVNVTVPRDFDGVYNVHLNNGAKLIEVPKTNQSEKSIVEIDAYSDVRIVKEK